jgi:hypothetical protein
MTSPEEHPDPDPLAELEAELDPGPAVPLFDEHGLPTGRLGAGVWTELLTRMEAVLEEGGWDAPPTLYALAGPVQTLARFHPEALERFQEHLVNLGGTTGAPTGPHGPVATPFSIVPLGQVEGPPVDHPCSAFSVVLGAPCPALPVTLTLRSGPGRAGSRSEGVAGGCRPRPRGRHCR